MRTLVRCTFKFEGNPDRERDVQRLLQWLAKCLYEPQIVELDEESRSAAMDDGLPLPSSVETNPALMHALEILRSIPIEDGERYDAATSTPLIVIRATIHASPIWSLVCVHHPHIDVRWRHRVTRVLEHATEGFVDWVWKSCHESNSLFLPFATGEDGAFVPVREPRATNDTYRGAVLPPRGKQRAALARRVSRAELATALLSLVLTAGFLVLAFVLFTHSSGDQPMRWCSGVFDRLATGFMAAGAMSYLTYWFRARELNRGKTIHWE